MERRSWKLVEAGDALVECHEPIPDPEAGEAVVQVAGCGICHTDLGFLHGEVKTRATLPLILGHEIAGTVVQTGQDCRHWSGRDVLVAAVIPCGECEACLSGRSNVCASQLMPGNDRDGGFATHVTVPVRGLVPIEGLPTGTALADLAVVADAVTTPLQAVRRAGVTADDLCVVVGAGGVGTYAVQIAAAAGAAVVAVDVRAERLEALREHGAAAVVDARTLGSREVRAAVRTAAAQLHAPPAGWKIFECSGTPAGQATAFALLGPRATLAIVGYTREPVSVRLSNLMAFDADAFGSWGCPVERYPEALQLVSSGAVNLRPFVRRMPMENIAEALELAASGAFAGRIVLTPRGDE